MAVADSIAEDNSTTLLRKLVSNSYDIASGGGGGPPVGFVEIYSGGTATPAGWTATPDTLYYDGTSVWADPSVPQEIETTHNGDLDGEFDLTGLPSLQTLDCSNNLITAIALPDSITELDASDNALVEAEVDAILDALDDFGAEVGFLYLTGNAPPSAAGLTDKASLEGKGWTVEVDVAEEAVYGFLDLAGTVDTIITDTLLNACMVGVVPGTWSYGPARHDGVDLGAEEVTDLRHTFLRNQTEYDLNPVITCDGQTIDAVTRVVEFDQDEAPLETDFEMVKWVPGETISGAFMVHYRFEMDRSLGADVGGTSIDVTTLYYGGVFSAVQQKIDTGEANIYLRPHGGQGIRIANSVRYHVFHLANKAGQLTQLLVLNDATGAFVGASQFAALLVDDLSIFYAGDYATNGDGQGRISAITFKEGADAVLPTNYTLPAATDFVAEQTDVGEVTLTWESGAIAWKIERNDGGGWMELEAAHTSDRTFADDPAEYVDATAVDEETYTYRVTPLVGSAQGATTTSDPVTIDDALFAEPTWTDAADSGDTTSNETLGAAIRQDLVCGTTGSCVKLRVFRRAGGTTGTAKMSLHSSTGTLLGQGSITNEELGTDGNWIEFTLVSPVAVTASTTYRIGFMGSSAAGIHTGIAPTGTASLYDFSTTFGGFPPNPYDEANSGTRTFALGMGVIPD